MDRSEARETAPRYLTPTEVAHDLRVSNNTVYAMLSGRELPAVRVRGQWRIPADQYARWEEEAAAPPGAAESSPLPRRQRNAGPHA